MVMQDFLGQSLHIGDKVIYAKRLRSNGSFALVKTTVIGFTNRFVKFPITDLPTYKKSYATGVPNLCIKYQDANSKSKKPEVINEKEDQSVDAAVEL